MTHGSGAPPSAQELPNPLAHGHRLGEFELLEVIGEGGFGIVYRAYDHSLQREVAIKEYMPALLARRVDGHSVHVRSQRVNATFEAGLRGFINEARTLAQFSHPALVRVHRFWEENNTAYMAIQLYKGRTLRRIADERGSETLSEAWLLDMLGPLLGALETLHARQCFHRDIAPDNIFIQDEGDQPVLLDFGAARKSIADMADEVAVMVKSGYSPIEQYADDNTLLQGPWTDLYALGAVLYRAVTGEVPPSAVVRSVQDNHVPLSSAGRSDLSPRFCAAVDRALAVHSKDRTQSVAEFAAELGLVKVGDSHRRRQDIAAAAVAAAAAPATPSVQAAPPAASAPAPLAPQDGLAAVEARPAEAVAEPAPAVAASRQAPPVVLVPQRRAGRAVAVAAVVALIVLAGWFVLRPASPPQDVATATPPPAPPQPPPPTALPAEPPAPAPEGAPLATEPPPAEPPVTGVGEGEGAVPPPATAPVPAPVPPPAAAVPEAPLQPQEATPPPPVPGQEPDPALAEAELADWELARAENTREGYEAYLRRHRRGVHAREARNAIAALARQARPEPDVAATEPAAANMVRVQFNIRPWGQVFVDGVDRGVSPPLKSLPLRPGIYNVEVRNGNLAAHRQSITVQDGRPAPVVSHEFK